MIIAIIPAKGGSNRLPKKNMYPLLGKPMLHYAIEFAKKSKLISKFYISTDNKSIAEYAKSRGIEVIIRSTELGGDTPLIDVYKHAFDTLQLKNVVTVVGVQPDHPDRNISLDESLEYYNNQKLDYLASTEKDGTKNGAHNIMDAKGLKNNMFINSGFIIDDCTNVHYEKDIIKAADNMKKQ
jgi:CMP-N-acetylneuraminic acid synthetase